MVWEKNVDCREGSLPNVKPGVTSVRRTQHWGSLLVFSAEILSLFLVLVNLLKIDPINLSNFNKFQNSNGKVVKTARASIATCQSNSPTLTISEPVAVRLHDRYDLLPLVDSGLSCSHFPYDFSSGMLESMFWT